MANYTNTFVCSCEVSGITDFTFITSGHDTGAGFHQSKACWPQAQELLGAPEVLQCVIRGWEKSLYQWGVAIASALWEDQNPYQLSAVLRCPSSGQFPKGGRPLTGFLLHLRSLLLNSRPIALRIELISILLVPVHYFGFWEQQAENLWWVRVGLKDS